MILSILVAGHLQVISHAKHVLFIIMSNYGFPCFPFDFLCSFYSSWISWQLDYNPDPSSYAVKYGVFRKLSKGSWSQKIPYLSECLLIFLNLSFFYFFFSLEITGIGIKFLSITCFLSQGQVTSSSRVSV